MKIKAILAVFVFSSIFTTVLYTRATELSNNKEMITQAISNDDTPKLIKTLITQMKEKLEVDEENFPGLIQEVEAYTATVADAPSRAVLHSMIAEMYNRYYQQNRWIIDRRTSIEGYVPEDIREWTSNLFTKKIEEELAASLQPQNVLRQTSVSQFSDIIDAGKDSPSLRPTLFDFLAYRALDIQPSEDIYQALLSFRRSQPDPRAALFAELKYMDYKYTRNLSGENQTRYEAALDSLLSVNADHDYSVEIIYAKLNLLRNKTYQSDSADSIRTLQYDLSKKWIARFPKYERIGLLTNWLASMEESNVHVQSNNTVYPGKNLEIKISYTNVSDIKVKVFRSLRKVEETSPYNYNSGEDKKDKKGDLIKELTFRLNVKNTYTQEDTTLLIPMEQPGLYEYELTSATKDIKAANIFSVSRLAASSRNTGPGKTEILVTDYLSGKPVNEAKVNYYKNNRNRLELIGSIKTDKDGLAVLPQNEGISAYQPYITGDVSSFITSIYIGRRSTAVNKEQQQLTLLTDRGIYRPGQTIFFKGIAYINDKENPQVVANKRFKIILRDANYQEVYTKEFTSNKFGSFTGEFTLPKQTLTGMFTLASENSSVTVRVEEYKRPTFKVEFLPVKEEVAFGDEVTIRGKAQTFSGVMLQSGDITYRIIRRPFWFRTYYGNFNEEQVAEGQLAVKDDGTFSFSFRPEKSGDSFPLAFQTYEVITSLTDSKGETQEARSTFSVGDRSMMLYTDIRGKMDKDSAEVQIKARTLNGEDITTKGTYTIHALEDTKDENVFKEGKLLAGGDFSTDKKLNTGVFANLPSGRLRLTMNAKDSKGRAVEEKTDFVLYSKQDKRPPVFTHTWILQEGKYYLPGEEAEVIFGTSDNNAYILYELFSNGKNVLRKRVELSNENRLFKIPFIESYGDGVTASFTFVKEGKLFTELVPVQRKRPDRNLTVKPETFRDRLLPGSNETWKFRIVNADSVPVIAEVLAGMYDASLDKILPFSWYFSPSSSNPFYYNRFSEGEGFQSRSGYASQSVKYKDVKDFVFDRLDWQGVMDINNYMSRRLYSGGVMMKAAAGVPPPMAMTESADAGILQENRVVSADMEMTEESEATGMQQQPETGTAQPQLRTNFNETAFFFPTLLTDKEGNVSVSFTIPESNTTWKLQALAHTTDLKYGLFTNEVITQKPLMILPNLPRFIRKGDQVSITAQIINQSGKATSGTARLELFNPDDDKIIGNAMQKPFSVTTDGTAIVSWSVNVPDNVDLAGLRIIADSDSGSDGEQHLLPVLSDEIMVTESTPFYLPGSGEKQVRLHDGTISSTRKPYRMTLEFSSNPVWYAVQALPTITQPDNENVIAWFASYYSNTLAASIARSNPRIKKVIDQWTAQGGDASTLLSNLEKNEELKNVLLEETPWVLEAKTETEQKQRLSLLFDTNRANSQREAAMRVLLEQQNDQGGWGWFKGFYPSRNITLWILNGMSQLVRLSAVQYNQQEKEMQMRALQYLDKTMQKDYESLKKISLPEDYLPSSEQLEFLYVRSYYRDIPEYGEAREAIRYYTEQAEKQWEKASLYGKGHIALVMHHNGKKEVARQILDWLRKTATVSEDMGMYWANNKRANNFFVSPVDVHCLLMTVFDELGSSTEETDRMKQWLLNQKRTQNWETAPSTVNAVYAILSKGTDWMNEKNGVTIQWGNHIWSDSGGETATGYIKETISGKDINPAENTVVIRKEGNAPAWGAVYDQYFESVRNIQKQKGELNVEKKLFIETNNGTERQIKPVAEGNRLRVGDKVIVRLVIRSDRDMDYVSLKDLRAGCFEPNVQLSGLAYTDGVMYYRAPKDVSENFYFDHLPAGTYVLEYAAFVSRAGNYSGGLATIQCQYAPEFVSHTEGISITVSE